MDHAAQIETLRDLVASLKRYIDALEEKNARLQRKLDRAKGVSADEVVTTKRLPQRAKGVSADEMPAMTPIGRPMPWDGQDK